MTEEISNDMGLNGLEFIEFSSNEPEKLDELFSAFGFSRLLKHKEKNLSYFNQGDIHYVVSNEPNSFGAEFVKEHGPSVSSMGWRVKDANKAFELAIQRGARAAEKQDLSYINGDKIPTIYGIGDSLIYFIEEGKFDDVYQAMGFETHPQVKKQEPLNFDFIDHLTNNVYAGELKKWSDFYKNIFNFYEIRYFDIRGVKTGLLSFALRSPCGKFCIPINEGTEKKSQINEYLEEYKGAGVQHIALHTNDIINAVAKLNKMGVETLDISPDYYKTVFDRVPNVTEDKKRLEELNILVDGDETGYILQIFTKNVIGPIFFEIIQRKNHHSFGEGNFGALFESIERDQMKRGYLD